MASTTTAKWGPSAEVYARIKQEEEGIRDLVTHEELILFDVDGCVLERAKGDKCSVELKVNRQLCSRTWICSHNHPIVNKSAQMIFARFEEYQEFLTSLRYINPDKEDPATLRNCLNEAYVTLADWFKASYIVEPREKRER